jgi:1,2-dihydroxy-3-keto-5-methylthiopentene dioxygenase
MTSLTLYDDGAPHALRGVVDGREAIVDLLAGAGVRLEYWQTGAPLPDEAVDADILAAYADHIDRLKADRGYRSCDVVRLRVDHPDREPLRSKFLAEHVHDDDEVRFFVDGAGLFYIRSGGAVLGLECTQGDLILLPAGTVHWFDTGEQPHFTAIRLFTTPDGWVARFTGDPIAQSIPAYAGAR